MNNPDFQIMVATWEDHGDLLARVRRAVFVEEQHVPEELEWDELDEACQHVLVLNNKSNPVGTGRLCGGGHIGRMAVVKDWRGKGVGRALLGKLVELARQSGQLQLVLNAQTSAAGFYARYGFTAQGDEFLDAGIPHLRMVRYLTDENGMPGGTDQVFP